MFLLIVFKDLQQTTPLCMVKCRFMKDLISATNGKITYNTIRQKKQNKKYVTKQNLPSN